jgi:hypothetical protein
LSVGSEKAVFEEITGGAEFLMLGKRKVAPRSYVAQFIARGPTSSARSANCPAASAIESTWRSCF